MNSCDTFRPVLMKQWTLRTSLERHDRILQLEIAIQEAIIFKNRYKELVSHIDPLVLVAQKEGQEAHPSNKIASSY